MTDVMNAMDLMTPRGAGVYFDGVTSARRQVVAEASAKGLLIIESSGRLLGRWAYAELRRQSAPDGVLRLGRHGETALARLTDALEQTRVAGVRTNVAFLGALCRAPSFREGKVDTGFIDRNLAALGAQPRGPDYAAAALGIERLLAAPDPRAVSQDAVNQDPAEIDSPWAARDGFQLGGVRAVAIPLVIDGEGVEATATYGNGGVRVAIGGAEPAADATAFLAGGEAFVVRHGRQTRVRFADVAAATAEAGAGDGLLAAPMHGKVLELFVAAGDAVTAGQRVAVIEAMKMEHTLRAPFSGTVVDVAARVGTQVVEGARIMLIERSAEG